jgi:hypothetical protein
MREFVKQIAVSLREDEHWVWRGSWIGSDKLKIQLWVKNLPFALTARVYDKRGIQAEDHALTVLEKLYIWRALIQFKKANRARIENDLVATIVSRRLNTKEES